MTEHDQQHPKKQQVSRHVIAADLVGDGRVDLYAGFCEHAEMSRPRLALIVGTLMLVSAAVVGCCAPAFLAPQPPWDDPAADQAKWDRTLLWLLTAGGSLLLLAFPLLAYGFVGWRMERRARVAARGQASQDQAVSRPSGVDQERRTLTTDDQ
ncbi:hypothetical protein ABZ570_26215 [Micromonospora sp. NPDC007271]|uniref:hypothetical protein n=1 Tax=Micromonospora sp. NPDC007271 TaxID=3154587 RepID=UPI0033E73D9E